MKPTPQESFSFSLRYRPWFAGKDPEKEDGSRSTALKPLIFSGEANSDTRGKELSGRPELPMDYSEVEMISKGGRGDKSRRWSYAIKLVQDLIV